MMEGVVSQRPDRAEVPPGWSYAPSSWPQRAPVIGLAVLAIMLLGQAPRSWGAGLAGVACLLAALAMLLMIPLTLDEVAATLQLLRRRRRAGGRAWRVLWRGGPPEEEPAQAGVHEARWRPAAMLWGFTPAWRMVLAATLGAWPLAAPGLFSLAPPQPATSVHHLLGALIVAVAVVAMAEVARLARFLLVPLGLWLAATPWFLDSVRGLFWAGDVLAGLAVVSLSLPPGRLREHYGALDRALRFSPGGITGMGAS
jgi:hypothetical protein